MVGSRGLVGRGGRGQRVGGVEGGRGPGVGV